MAETAGVRGEMFPAISRARTAYWCVDDGKDRRVGVGRARSRLLSSTPSAVHVVAR